LRPRNNSILRPALPVGLTLLLFYIVYVKMCNIKLLQMRLRTFHHQEKAESMSITKTFMALLAVAALAVMPSQALASEAEPASAGASANVTIIHDVELHVIVGESEYQGTCTVKFFKNLTQYHCHGKLVVGTPPNGVESLSSLGFSGQGVITPAGTLSLNINK